MMSLQEVHKEVSRLTTKWWELIEIFDEVTTENADDYDWLDIADDLNGWYYSSAQVMRDTQFVGYDRFVALFEDTAFSIPRHVTRLVHYVSGTDADAHSECAFRLWQMYFILCQVTVAMASVRANEFLGTDVDQIRALIDEAATDIAEDRVAAVGTKIRTILEHSVNFACVVNAAVVNKRDPTHKCATFNDKIEALKQKSVINGTEQQMLANAFSMFSKCPHPGEKPAASSLKNVLDSVKPVIEKKLLAKPKV